MPEARFLASRQCEFTVHLGQWLTKCKNQTHCGNLIPIIPKKLSNWWTSYALLVMLNNAFTVLMVLWIFINLSQNTGLDFKWLKTTAFTHFMDTDSMILSDNRQKQKIYGFWLQASSVPWQKWLERGPTCVEPADENTKYPGLNKSGFQQNLAWLTGQLLLTWALMDAEKLWNKISLCCCISHLKEERFCTKETVTQSTDLVPESHAFTFSNCECVCARGALT